jgi:hypothetical protein
MRTKRRLPVIARAGEVLALEVDLLVELASVDAVEVVTALVLLIKVISLVVVAIVVAAVTVLASFRTCPTVASNAKTSCPGS